MNVAIILAGGVGRRVGDKKPKQFIEVNGKPIIAYTIEVFENHKEVDAIEIVCVKEYIEYLKEIIKKYEYKKVNWIVEGGENIKDSTLNGINNLNGKIDDNDIVFLNSAVSPLMTEEIITDGIKVCKEKESCISAIPCYSLLGSNDNDEKSTKWIDRRDVMMLANPHFFKFNYLKKIYDTAKEKGYLKDEDIHTTTLMYLLGETVYFSKGSTINIKITTKEDIELFKAYLMLNNMNKKKFDLFF